MVDRRVGNTISGLKFQKISGSVLIIVLLLSLIISMMVMIALESSVLQTTITRNYQFEVLNFIDAEQSLQKLENKTLHEMLMFKSGFSHKAKQPTTKLQFVADTLAFGERHGIDYYLLDINQVGLDGAQTHLQSVISVRYF